MSATPRVAKTENSEECQFPYSSALDFLIYPRFLHKLILREVISCPLRCAFLGVASGCASLSPTLIVATTHGYRTSIPWLSHLTE